MANTIKTLSDGDITREALRIFKNSNNVIKCVNRQYDDRFAVSGAKNGGSLQIRLPNRYTVGTGATITPQDTTENTVGLVVATQKHVPVQFSSAELTVSLDDFSERILQPAMSVLASNVGNDLLTDMASNFHQIVGTPGTTPASLTPYLDAGVKIDHQTAPRDSNRHVIVGPAAMGATVDGLKGLFQSSDKIASQYETGMMGMAAGFKFWMDQGIPTIAHGAANGSYLVNGAVSSSTGTTSIVVDTGAGAAVAGQVFTIAGIFEVNPDTKQSTGQLKQFVVATNYAGGAGTITVAQKIYTSGPYQNVSGTIADNAAITFFGTASTSYPRNFAFHRDAVVLATADLELPKGVDMGYRASMDGLSLRFVRDYDVTNDLFIGRFDILYGKKVVRPEWGCQITG